MHYTHINLSPNIQFLSTQEHAYQSCFSYFLVVCICAKIVHVIRYVNDIGYIHVHHYTILKEQSKQ